MSEATTTISSPIVLTDSALKQLRDIMTDQGVPETYGLRVGVKGGGCSGFSYVLGFDERKDKDQAYDVSGINVFIDRAHAMYLIGMEIDWHEGLNNRGFVFTNPNATDTCGCGESFSA